MSDVQIADYAASQAAELKHIGINLNLAPVVDVYQPKVVYTGRHTRITDRSFGTDPQKVARVANVYAQTFNRYGIKTTAKHFPGIGIIGKDTHLEVDHIAQLADTDLYPFMSIASQSSTLWMLSHAILEEYDSSRSASFSQAVVQNLIRQKLNFHGQLITDDMGMGAIANPVEAITLAHQAGIDYILLVTDFQKILPEVLSW
jgi:beta-N-acetylhexosaminidase